ncbi:MAG: DUF1028 domain-containing protein [Pseudomonadota bacterium]
MTWSIIARDASGAFGVAVASKFFAVGALCPHAQSGIGALATQALLNPLYVKPAFAALELGKQPEQIVEELIAGDDGRDQRQLHIIDAHNRSFAHTGSACVPWCGHTAGDGYSVAGNMLAGPEVVESTAKAYEQGSHLSFGERLLAALAAGDAAGGDKRGKQGAALVIYTTEDYPALDLRVDDHDEPIVELRRLYEKSLERYQPFTACLASRDNPAGLIDRALLEAEVTRFHEALQSGRKGVAL